MTDRKKKLKDKDLGKFVFSGCFASLKQED
jgi:hypothetical protein